MSEEPILPNAIVRTDECGRTHAIFVFTVAGETTAWDVVSYVQKAFASGVRSVWVVFRNIQRVFVFDAPNAVRVLTRADELTAEPVVPGFRMPMAELFPLMEEEPPATPA